VVCALNCLAFAICGIGIGILNFYENDSYGIYICSIMCVSILFFILSIGASRIKIAGLIWILFTTIEVFIEFTIFVYSFHVIRLSPLKQIFLLELFFLKSLYFLSSCLCPWHYLHYRAQMKPENCFRVQSRWFMLFITSFLDFICK